MTFRIVPPNNSKEMNDADRILGPHGSRNISAVVTVITPVGRNINRNLRAVGSIRRMRLGIRRLGEHGPFFMGRQNHTGGTRLAAGRLYDHRLQNGRLAGHLQRHRCPCRNSPKVAATSLILFSVYRGGQIP
jgi:hypothetical protein